MVTRGLFGRPHMPREVECDCPCAGCCDTDFADFPEIIYVNFQFPDDGPSYTDEVSAKMYKLVTLTDGSDCRPRDCYSAIEYHSDTVLLNSVATVATDVCCITASLYGTCNQGTPGNAGACTWSWSLRRGDDICIGPTAITLSCLMEGSVNHDVGGGDECFDDESGDSIIHITFSETDPGTPNTMCDKLCCDPLPAKLYVTLESNCDLLDGKVIEVTRDEASCPQQFPPTYNLNGQMGINWTGRKKLCTCDDFIRVDVSINTWSGTNPNCRWTVGIGSSECFVGWIEEHDDDFCLPIEVTGDWIEGVRDECDDCCPATVESESDPSVTQLSLDGTPGLRYSNPAIGTITITATVSE